MSTDWIPEDILKEQKEKLAGSSSESETELAEIPDNLKPKFEQLQNQAKFLSQTVFDLQDRVRSEMSQKAYYQNKLIQTEALVEGHFQGTPDAALVGLRLSQDATDATQDLEEAVNYLNPKKRTFLPYVIVIGIFALIYAIVPSNAGGIGSWISTPTGSIFIILLIVVILFLVVGRTVLNRR